MGLKRGSATGLSTLAKPAGALLVGPQDHTASLPLIENACAARMLETVAGRIRLASALQKDCLLDPADNSWIALRRQGLLRLSALLREGLLRPSDALVLMVLATHQRMRTAQVRLTLEDLRQLLQVGSVGPVSHSMRRLRALGLVARVGGERGRGYYVVSPAFSSCGNLRERQHHERLFKAALKQQAPIRPATPGDVASRHALPSQLEPAAA